MKIAVLLSGCGVYDGAEIQESVFTLLALERLGAEVQCLAPDIMQYHVLNHLNGEEMPEQRNVLLESARIARGKVLPMHKAKATDFDAVAIPGGFGVAKNFTKWGIKGASGEIDQVVSKFIRNAVQNGIPVAALCMAPTTVAKALQDTGLKSSLTVGNLDQASPYDIAAISEGMKTIGVDVRFCDKEGIYVDEANKIISSPCYMMEASISEVFASVSKAMAKLVEMVAQHEVKEV